jgi:hypothetical protein
VTDVWDYVGDSGNAAEWSVYFHHISPLSHGSSDGTLGSVRRCYRMPDQTGVTWDEEVVRLTPLRERRIRVYNIAGGKLGRFASGVELWVVQRYDQAEQGRRCTLTFSTGIDESHGLLHRVLFRIASREVARIFRANLQNIAAAVERGDAYARRHTWEARNIFD